MDANIGKDEHLDPVSGSGDLSPAGLIPGTYRCSIVPDTDDLEEPTKETSERIVTGEERRPSTSGSESSQPSSTLSGFVDEVVTTDRTPERIALEVGAAGERPLLSPTLSEEASAENQEPRKHCKDSPATHENPHPQNHDTHSRIQTHIAPPRESVEHRAAAVEADSAGEASALTEADSITKGGNHQDEKAADLSNSRSSTGDEPEGEEPRRSDSTDSSEGIMGDQHQKAPGEVPTPTASKDGQAAPEGGDSTAPTEQSAAEQKESQETSKDTPVSQSQQQQDQDEAPAAMKRKRSSLKHFDQLQMDKLVAADTDNGGSNNDGSPATKSPKLRSSVSRGQSIDFDEFGNPRPRTDAFGNPIATKTPKGETKKHSIVFQDGVDTRGNIMVHELSEEALAVSGKSDLANSLRGGGGGGTPGSPPGSPPAIIPHHPSDPKPAPGDIAEVVEVKSWKAENRKMMHKMGGGGCCFL